MRYQRRLLPVVIGCSALVTGLVGCGGGGDNSPAPDNRPRVFQSLIKVPNVGPAPGFNFDDGVIDASTETYFLSDRTNKGIDIVDAKTNTFLATVPGFVGQFPSNSVSGPNGLAVVGTQVYAADGDSTVKIIDVASRTIIKTLSTGGVNRADAIAFDPDDNIVLVNNDSDAIPFVTFIDSKSATIVGKLSIPSTQLDAMLYDPTAKKFFVSVTSTTANPGGEIDAIDPKTQLITARYPVSQCLPGGLAIGPSEHLLVGCSGDAIAAGFPASSIVLDAATGKVLATLTQIGGSDEVTYNAGDQKFYLAGRNMTSNGLITGTPTPVLGIIDAVNLTYIASLPTSKNSKSVAADPVNNKVFVPLTDVPGPGLGVYGPAS